MEKCERGVSANKDHDREEIEGEGETR